MKIIKKNTIFEEIEDCIRKFREYNPSVSSIEKIVLTEKEWLRFKEEVAKRGAHPYFSGVQIVREEQEDFEIDMPVNIMSASHRIVSDMFCSMDLTVRFDKNVSEHIWNRLFNSIASRNERFQLILRPLKEKE